jgi:hypothetical protein
MSSAPRLAADVNRRRRTDLPDVYRSCGMQRQAHLDLLRARKGFAALL